MKDREKALGKIYGKEDKESILATTCLYLMEEVEKLKDTIKKLKKDSGILGYIDTDGKWHDLRGC